MKAIVNRTAPFVHPVELPLKVHCLFQMKLFNMPATYPVKLDKPSRHPKSFIITQITIIVIKVLLNPTTPYLIACLIVSILIYNLGNLLRCQFLDIRDRENIREEIAVLVTFIDHPIYPYAPGSRTPTPHTAHRSSNARSRSPFSADNKRTPARLSAADILGKVSCL